VITLYLGISLKICVQIINFLQGPGNWFVKNLKLKISWRLPQVNVIYEPYLTHVHIIQLFSTLPPLRPSIFTEKMIPALPDKKDDAVKKTESHKYIPGRFEYYFHWAWDVNCWSKVANACPIIIDLWISVQYVRTYIALYIVVRCFHFLFQPICVFFFFLYGTFYIIYTGTNKSDSYRNDTLKLTIVGAKWRTILLDLWSKPMIHIATKNICKFFSSENVQKYVNHGIRFHLLYYRFETKFEHRSGYR
jgi:hypothetical protein